MGRVSLLKALACAPARIVVLALGSGGGGGGDDFFSLCQLRRKVKIQYTYRSSGPISFQPDHFPFIRQLVGELTLTSSPSDVPSDSPTTAPEFYFLAHSLVLRWLHSLKAVAIRRVNGRGPQQAFSEAYYTAAKVPELSPEAFSSHPKSKSLLCPHGDGSSGLANTVPRSRRIETNHGKLI